jgi:predicted O-methyltransferase YrrM
MNWTTIEGWFSSADASFVTEICKKIHNGIVVELGFFAGRSTAVMAPICISNNTEYHAVDNCAGACERDPATKAQKSRDMKKVFENNMNSLGLLDHIHVHQLDSAVSAQMFSENEVDFCFIDASHVEEDVKRDIEAWWSKVKEGGVLAGHDYSWGSVKNATGAFVKAHGLKLIISGNCWKITK